MVQSAQRLFMLPFIILIHSTFVQRFGGTLDQTCSTAILSPAAFKIAYNVENRGLPLDDSAR